MITKHSKLLSVIDAIETGCSPFEVKKMAKYDNFKLFSDSSDDESDVSYQILAILVLLGN